MKKIIVILVSIIVVAMLVIIGFMLFQKNSPKLLLTKGSAMTHFDISVNLKSFNNNTLEYQIKIKPKEAGNKKYENVKMNLIIVAFAKKADSGEKRATKFITEEIKIKEDGTYDGVVAYTIESDEKFDNVDSDYKYSITTISGTVQ